MARGGRAVTSPIHKGVRASRPHVPDVIEAQVIVHRIGGITFLIHARQSPAGHPGLVHLGFHEHGIIRVGPEEGSQKKHVFLEAWVVVLLVGNGLFADVQDVCRIAPGNSANVDLGIKVNRIGILAPLIIPVSIPGQTIRLREFRIV